MTFTTSATTNKVFIYANIWNGYGQFWLDDVKLYEKWTDENLILNGGMEQGKVMNYSLDGIGFDMIFSDWVWATLEDYRKENWKYIDLPLALNYSYGEPVLLQAFSNYEYLENIREKVNLTYANINTGYNLYAHMLDIM